MWFKAALWSNDLASRPINRAVLTHTPRYQPAYITEETRWHSTRCVAVFSAHPRGRLRLGSCEARQVSMALRGKTNLSSMDYLQCKPTYRYSNVRDTAPYTAIYDDDIRMEIDGHTHLARHRFLTRSQCTLSSHSANLASLVARHGRECPTDWHRPCLSEKVPPRADLSSPALSPGLPLQSDDHPGT